MAKPLMDPGLQYLSASLGVYGNAETDDKSLYRLYEQLYKIRNDAYTRFDANNTRRRIAQLEGYLTLNKSANDTTADILETLAQSGRVTSKNYTDLKTVKEQIDAKLTAELSAPTPAWADADAAFIQRKGQGQDAGLRAAAEALVKWQSTVGGGRAIDPSNPDIAPLMNRFAKLALGKNLDQTTPDEIMRSLGKVSDSLAASFRPLVEAGYTRFNDLTSLQRQNRQNLSWLGENASQFAAGAPGSRAAVEKLRSIVEDTKPALQRALGATAADIQMERQLLLEENEYIKGLNEDVELLKKQIFGGGRVDPIGRLVAKPEFRTWAEANGYSLGPASYDEETGELVYTPGKDDAEAVSLFNYQAKTEKYHPLRKTKSTGALVRVTVEDPAVQEQVLRQYQSGDGQFFLNEQGDLVRPSEAADELRRLGVTPSVQYAKKGGKTYLSVGGKIIDGETGAPVESPPANLAFKPALHYSGSGDAEKVRYLTADDVGSPEKVAALSADNAIGVDTGDSNDKAKLAITKKNAPVKSVGEDQVRRFWSRQHTGYLDAMNAADVVGKRQVMVNGKMVPAGPNAISLDGGAVIIPSSTAATIEVLKTKNRMKLGDIAKGWRQRMSSAEAQRLGFSPDAVPMTFDAQTPRELEELDVSQAAALGRQAMAEYGAAGREAKEGPAPVVVPYTEMGGTKAAATVSPTSAAARTAAATGVDVVSTEKKRYRATDGKVYELDGATGGVELVSGGKSGEKTSWTAADLAADTGLQASLSGAALVEETTPATAAPAQPAGLPPGVTAQRAGSRAVVSYARPQEPSMLERVGAGAAELFIPGSPEERRAKQEADRREARDTAAARRRAAAEEPPPEPGEVYTGGPIDGDIDKRRGGLGGIIDRLRERKEAQRIAKALEDKGWSEERKKYGPAPIEPDDLRSERERLSARSMALAPSPKPGAIEPRETEVVSSPRPTAGAGAMFGSPLLDKVTLTEAMKLTLPGADAIKKEFMELEGQLRESERARDYARRTGAPVPAFDSEGYNAKISALAKRARELTRVRPDQPLNLGGAVKDGRVRTGEFDVDEQTAAAKPAPVVPVAPARRGRSAAKPAAPKPAVAPPAPPPAPPARQPPEEEETRPPSPPLSPEVRSQMNALPSYMDRLEAEKHAKKLKASELALRQGGPLETFSRIQRAAKIAREGADATGK